MKVKVLNTFVDKYDRSKVYKKDTVIQVSKERFEEINSTEYGELGEEVEDETVDADEEVEVIQDVEDKKAKKEDKKK